MIPGPARILVCPHCGAEKKVLSLRSGNTFRGCQWSDGKKDYPMLPQVSPVQKCPQCGKYYFTDSNERKNEDDRDWSFERGLLSYEEAKEAYYQFDGQQLNDDECIALYSVFITAHNDSFNRDRAKSVATAEGKSLFKSVVVAYLEVLRKHRLDTLFEAEFLREIEDFDGAMKLLEGYENSEPFLKGIAETIKSRALAGDTKAFAIGG